MGKWLFDCFDLEILQRERHYHSECFSTDFYIIGKKNLQRQLTLGNHWIIWRVCVGSL
jgi:hypothetical protein